MKKITLEELEVFLRKHKLWLVDDPNGSRADLCGADLRGANLCEADLRGANLCEANLCGVDLRGANLRGANLCEANLCEANLCEANLCGVDLRGANLCGADLRGAKNVNYPIACPEKGSFTAFKKASGHIVELQIPEEALRSSAASRKCRCSKAVVVSITNIDGAVADVTSVASGYDSNFIYTVGETVSVDNFDENRWNECAPGIHFFITRQEAVDYFG